MAGMFWLLLDLLQQEKLVILGFKFANAICRGMLYLSFDYKKYDSVAKNCGGNAKKV